jgi:hypothetical protein
VISGFGGCLRAVSSVGTAGRDGQDGYQARPSTAVVQVIERDNRAKHLEEAAIRLDALQLHALPYLIRGDRARFRVDRPAPQRFRRDPSIPCTSSTRRLGAFARSSLGGEAIWQVRPTTS